MKKKILSLMVLSVLSTLTFAQEPQVTEILREHVDRIPTPRMVNQTAQCNAVADAVTTTAGMSTVIPGHAIYTLNNRTGQTQNYNIDEYICLEGNSCTHVRKTITLSDNQSVNRNETIYVNVVLMKGTYIDSMSLQVDGESNCFVKNQNTVTAK